MMDFSGQFIWRTICAVLVWNVKIGRALQVGEHTKQIKKTGRRGLKGEGQGFLDGKRWRAISPLQTKILRMIL
jgi:hypothetical protein